MAATAVAAAAFAHEAPLIEDAVHGAPAAQVHAFVEQRRIHLGGGKVAGKTAARARLAAWFHRYNHTRRHSHCGLLAPITYETATVNAAKAA